MIPITRKDHYLNEIVGWGDTAPEKPYIEEEFFFAEILGEAVQAPEPLPRYQMYLAKIAGREIEIPYPKVRLEYFLAKAAGMDITVPVPITREEIFWSNYSAIVDFEVEGVPPLTYKAIEGTLENYRIYGNTVNGESVGDRTGNLFDGEVEQGTINTSGAAILVENRVRTIFYNRKLSVGTYTISANGVNGVCVMAYITSEQSSYDSSESVTSWPSLPHTFTLSSDRFVRFIFKERENNADIPITPSDISNIMLNSGSTALPYEPYGYRVPVSVTNGTDTETTNIYLPEPIKMVGDEAEYIDYAEQKQHRVRKNLLKNTASSQTIKGVTFTKNDDGSVTCNGTSLDTVQYTIYLDFQLPAGNYRLTGTPPTGSFSTYYLRAWYPSLGSVVWLNDNGNGCNFTLTDTTTMRSSIVILPSQVLDHVTFYPMIRKADIGDDTYEPYIENTDLDVTLPALPTLPGTNVLSVGTAVQPSKVYVKGTKEREYT